MLRTSAGVEAGTNERPAQRSKNARAQGVNHGLLFLRAQCPEIPVVVVSANDDPSVIRRCMDFGASGFIPKTLGTEAMRSAIMRVLKGGVWTPPDVDLQAGADAEAAALMARLATLTPQQVRVLMKIGRAHV